MGKRGPKPKRKPIVWSADFAYAVGLIATDGCLSNDGRHLLFVSKDIEQIENLKKCLNLTVKTGVHMSGQRFSDKKYHRVQWGDVILYDFLISIGLTPNKSRTLGTLAIPDEFFLDFLRGSFDGDGCFYSYFDPRWKSSFMFYLNFTSASRKHIDWLQQTLARLMGVSGHISRTRGSKKDRNEILNLRYAKKEALIVMQAMYGQGQPIYLSRKKLKIQKALRIVGLSLSKDDMTK